MITKTFYTHNNTRFVFIDGLLCNTIDKVYATLQQQLSIPEYFGNNLDALEEVLADVEWVEEEKIKIIIINSSILLSNEDAGVKEGFMAVLKANDNYRIQMEY
jgi:RNAse (barnase) inhibitor barstar